MKNRIALSLVVLALCVSGCVSIEGNHIEEVENHIEEVENHIEVVENHIEVVESHIEEVESHIEEVGRYLERSNLESVGMDPDAGYEAEGEGVIRYADKENSGLVKVLFATNRKLLNSSRCTGAFSGRRGDFKDTKYGYCYVSIPVGHKVGMVEEKRWYQLRENENDHVMLLGGRTMPKEDFIAILERGLAKGDASTLLFVHGYNVSFETAAKRTAQMAHDLNFAGVPLFFSWPSNGRVLSYQADEASIEWSEPALYDFLQEHLDNQNIRTTYLIAHSMGNRAVLDVLIRLKSERPDLRAKIREVVLAAPDVDADQFTDIIVPKLADPDFPVTLYASRHDKALKLSKELHYYRRAGDIPDDILVWRGVEFINASSVKTDFLNHSYVSDSNSVLSDMFYLFSGKRPSSRFHLRERSSRTGQYWEFK